MDAKHTLSDRKNDIVLLKTNFASTILSKVLTSILKKQGIDAKIMFHSIAVTHHDADGRVMINVDATVDASEATVYKLLDNM